MKNKELVKFLSQRTVITGLEGFPDNCPEENCSQVRVRVRVRANVQFSSGAIVLEPSRSQIEKKF